ncbi:MAG: ABC transporter ATP-binding protein [Planctomycetes bacterium]|nr:ABC transporter ATP-binding protein [Planctomycetota bacterium]
MIPNASDILVRTEHLTKIYPDGHVNALRDVSLEIRRGEYVAIMGPSGSGKSTLLSMLGALDRPTSGEVYFEGEPLSRMSNLDRFRSEKIGFVFQSFYLLPTLSALENVQIPMFEGKLPPKERVERAKELLAAVNMSHRADHLPTKLSVGERQRVAIARSLANDPVLLFGDEPTGNLDTKTADTILALFERLHQKSGVTLVIVTHSDEVAAHAGRTIHIRDGQVAEDIYAEQVSKSA